MLGVLPGHARRMLRFAIVGLVNTAVDVALFSYLYYAQAWPLLWANSAGYVAGLTNSFLCNHFWTFRRKSTQISPKRTTLFALINLAGMVLANLTIALLALLMAPWAAKLGALAVTFGWNYWASQKYVFPPDSEGSSAPRGRHG